MATICAVLHHKMPHHFWTGFYFVAAEDQLHVGPYQGPVACQVLEGWKVGTLEGWNVETASGHSSEEH